MCLLEEELVFIINNHCEVRTLGTCTHTLVGPRDTRRDGDDALDWSPPPLGSRSTERHVTLTASSVSVPGPGGHGRILPRCQLSPLDLSLDLRALPYDTPDTNYTTHYVRTILSRGLSVYTDKITDGYCTVCHFGALSFITVNIQK